MNAPAGLIQPPRFRAAPWVAGVSLSLVCACGSNDGQTDNKAAIAAFADTALGSNKADPNAEAREAEAAARREAYAKKQAEEKAREKQRDDLLAQLAVLPENPPKSLDDACGAMLESYEAFVIRSNADDDRALLQFYDNKRVILGERRGKCVKVGSVDAAACQAHALAQAPNELRGEELTILSACVDKFAPHAAERVAAAEKPADADG